MLRLAVNVLKMRECAALNRIYSDHVSNCRQKETNDEFLYICIFCLNLKRARNKKKANKR